MPLAALVLTVSVLGPTNGRYVKADVTVSVRKIDGSTIRGTWEQCDNRGSIAVGTNHGRASAAQESRTSRPPDGRRRAVAH